MAIGDNLTPLDPGSTQTLGIHQSDIVIRTAIVQALKDLRANPWKLDYVFASLPKDDLTAKSYGSKELEQAKSWFLKTEIPVYMQPRIDEAKVPAISIKLVESSESEVTLGDVNYVEQEDAELDWPNLAGPFNPIGYDVTTGNMALPDLDLVIVAGMLIFDATGKEHVILDVTDTGIQIAPGTVADFTGAVIKGQRPMANVTLESAWYRETYQLGAHVSGEPVYLTWLHSILVFILLHYKQDLLESRGFERSSFNSSDFDRNEVSDGELVFSRFITINGNVRQYWPKRVQLKLTSLTPFPLVVEGGAKLPNDTDPNNALWIGDEDTLGGK